MNTALLAIPRNFRRFWKQSDRVVWPWLCSQQRTDHITKNPVHFEWVERTLRAMLCLVCVSTVCPYRTSRRNSKTINHNIAWFIVDRLQRELDDTGDNVNAVHHDMFWNAEMSAKCPASVYFGPWLALAANLTGFCLSRVGGELQYPLFLTLLGFYFIFTRRVKLCNLRGM